MTSNDFILYTEVKKLYDFFFTLTLKNEQILHFELIFLIPSNPQPILAFLRTQPCQVQQIKHVFVINLQKWNVNSNVFRFIFSLKLDHIPDLFNRSRRDPNIWLPLIRLNHPSIRSFWRFVLFIRVTFHCVRFSRSSLPISEYCGMIAIHNSSNHFFNSQAVEHVFLLHVWTQHFVEFVVFRFDRVWSFFNLAKTKYSWMD